jgi:hypothetical protein
MPERSPQSDVARGNPISWGVSATLHGLILIAGFCWAQWPTRSPAKGDVERQLTVALLRPSPKSPTDPESLEGEADDADFQIEVPFEVANGGEPNALPGSIGPGLPGVGLSVPSLEETIGRRTPIPFEPSQASTSSAKGQGPASGSKARKASPELVAEVMAAEAERAQKEAAQGSPVAIGMFGTAPASGRKFVFALDRSKSMGTQGLNILRTAQAEVVKAVGQLESNHRFQVIIYNEDTVMLGRRDWTEPTAENRLKLSDLFDSLGSHGATDHFGALQTALRLSPDVVFLVSDGADPVLNVRQQQKLIDTAAGRTQIICLLFCRGKLAHPEAAQSLKRIAEATGGTCHVFDVAASGGKPNGSP